MKRIGARHGNFKLTDTQVEKLRAYHAEGWTYSQLAERFGISRGSVKGVLDRGGKA